MGAGILLATAALAAALLWLRLVRRSGLQRASGGDAVRVEHARLAQIAALLLLGLGAAFFLLFAAAELAGGDVAGIQHLLPAAILGALIWLGWRRPRTTGVILLALAVPLGVAIVVGVAVGGVRPEELWVALPIASVPVLTASLLLWAGRGHGGRPMP